MDMAMKKNTTNEPLQKAQSGDTVVYKVMIALVLTCASLLALRALRRYYATVEGFTALYDLTPTIVIAGLVLAAAAAVLTIVWKNKIVRLVAPWFLVAGMLVAATGWNMRESGISDFPFLYFLCFAVLAQYIIFLLYRWEFFLFSLSTVTAGGVFLSFSRGLYWTPKNIVVMALLALVVVGTTVCCRVAYHNKGCLPMGKLRIQLFSPKSAPMLIYIVNVLWLLCAVAVALLGGLFAYYCMFAAIAVEFIAAVYYTFQLN